MACTSVHHNWEVQLRVILVQYGIAEDGMKPYADTCVVLYVSTCLP